MGGGAGEGPAGVTARDNRDPWKGQLTFGSSGGLGEAILLVRAERRLHGEALVRPSWLLEIRPKDEVPWLGPARSCLGP